MIRSRWGVALGTLTVITFGALLTAVSLGAASNNGNSATILDAVTNADVAAVRALVKSGADVNVAAPDGSTPLHWAVNKGDRELVQILLKAGAKAGVANRYGVT